MKRNLWRCATAVFAAALILCVFGDVAVAALDLKIGYFDYDGYVTVDENGQITGYVGDILDMLVEANPHWNFVPVLFERASFNENMRKGYAVLSMQTPYAAASPRYYLYSEYPVGVEWGIFYTSLDQHIYYEDFAMFEGMRVGSIATDLQNSLFDEYQAANGFSVEYVLFNNLDDMKKALADKEIDGLIYGSVVEQEDLKIVARYAEVPLHVAGNEWGASFVDYFDRVLGAALAEDPYFFDALYAKYYDDAPRAVQAMTEEEEKAAELARIAEEEAAAKAAAEEAARKAEEEARRAVEEAAAAAQADGDQPDENVDGDGDMEKKLTQAGFIIVVALLAVLLISALIRNKSRKIAKTAKPAQAIKPEKAAKPAKAEKEARIKAQKEAKAKAEEEARVEAENEARRKAEEEARAKAEEEAKIAEEAAKKAMEEAKIKAEEDAKNRLIEEARIRALEIARFKAEEEARMKNEEARRQNQKPVAMQTGSLRETAPIEETGRANDGKNTEGNNIVPLPGRFDILSDAVWEQEEAVGATEYTDDQIRGEIYLSGLTISLQPRYAVNQSTIAGAEVSISCRHPIRDRVYPEELVQSLIQKEKLQILDRYIFESICLCKPHEKVNSFEAFEIVVPIFTESLLCADFSQWYIETAQKYQIPPGIFRLDLVYRWQTDEDKHIYHALQELSGAGFRVALKDVGNANYPVELLSEVDLEAIVIAEQLLVDALTNEKKKKLLDALKGLCTQMNFRMEADRIDSREKLQLATRVGCQIFQGNFLTRAIPFEQFWDFTNKVQTRIVS